MQLTLCRPPPPPSVPGIDLRCVDVGALLRGLHPGSVDLVVADPPWDLYRERPGVAAPDLAYSLLTELEIGAHLGSSVALLRPGGRLALWTCWPLLAEALSGPERPPWLAVPGLRWVTGGAWVKTDARPGVGYHWRGKAEPVLLGVVEGPAGRAATMLRSGWASDAEEHSRKPVAWLAEWLRAWVPPGGLVVDMYAGLGSVAEAVLEAGEGRRYLGAEIDEERHHEALTRVFRRHRGQA